MQQMKLTPRRRQLLEWIERADGKLQLLQITASGGRGYSMLQELRRAGYAELGDHPDVMDATRTYPVEAVFITDAGRTALQRSLRG